MDQALRGKVALITGGGTGIGYAAAESLMERGDINGCRADWLGQALARLDHSACGVAADVTRKADMERVAARNEAEKGQVDIVFANAGIGSYLALDKVTEEHFDATSNTKP